MNKAICLVPVAPMRAEGSHKSEQVSQLVFGDVCEVLDINNDFVLVRGTYDGYQGWCQKVQVQLVDNDAAYFPTVLTCKWVSEVLVNEKPMMVPAGSNIGFCIAKPAIIGAYNVTTKEEGFAVPLKPTKELLQQVALMYLNTAYQWGGRTVFGVDCSGFTQMVYRFCGVQLMRDASQQATQGQVVDFLQEATLGDLAFFDNGEGHITHVGIMLNNQQIIHASGKVRIDTIDHAGIVNAETNIRTHKLRIIKRIL
jgi:hypothetical protein